jgi:hypothetical protein
MTTRIASLLAAAALAGAVGSWATPALAQHHSDGPPPLPDPAWDQDEPSDWQADGDRADGPEWRDDQDGDWDRAGPPPGLPPMIHGQYPGMVPHMGYSPEQRAEWLEQCHQAFYDGRGERRGEAIGAVLGGAAGAIAGNRIADNHRLAGTLIGGGAGALAGAAVGGAIGEAHDRDRFDECETYLARYEQSFAGGPGMGRSPGMAYSHHAEGYGFYPGFAYPGPVMWVRVPIIREHRRDCGCQEVVEEVVEERASPPPRPRPAPAPRREKRVRYSK